MQFRQASLAQTRELAWMAVDFYGEPLGGPADWQAFLQGDPDQGVRVMADTQQRVYAGACFRRGEDGCFRIQPVVARTQEVEAIPHYVGPLLNGLLWQAHKARGNFDCMIALPSQGSSLQKHPAHLRVLEWIIRESLGFRSYAFLDQGHPMLPPGWGVHAWVRGPSSTYPVRGQCYAHALDRARPLRCLEAPQH